MSNNTLSRDSFTYAEGKYKTIHYGDILTKYGTVKNINDNDVPFIIDRIKCNNDILRPGDIVIADTSEDYTVGKSIEIAGSSSIPAYSGLHTIALRPNIKFAEGFIAYYINSKVFKKRIYPLIQGIKVYSISKTNLSNCIIKYPSYDIQLKITILLKNIDNRINTQKKIIEEIKLYKKYILNKIFIDNGLIIEGKEKALNNVLIPGNKEPVNTSLYSKINVHLNLNGISYATVTRKMSDIRPFYLRHKGELIIGKQNYFNGSIAIIPEKYDNTICSNAIMSFIIKDEYDSDFIYYAISNNSFLKFRSHIANGTGQKELSEKDFLNFKIRIPVLARQKNIANSLRFIEEKIINEEKILKLYQKQKDYLLNKMFI